MKRRNFLKSSIGFGLVSMAGIGGVFLAQSAPYNINSMGKINNIGVQLYTVRDRTADNLEATVEKVAAIGYNEVEFAGYFDRSANDIRTMLDNNGLTSPSVHIGLDAVNGDFDAFLENANVIGHQYITVASVDASMRQTLDQLKTARRTVKICKRVAPGINQPEQIHFHHHQIIVYVIKEHIVGFDPFNGFEFKRVVMISQLKPSRFASLPRLNQCLGSHF